jgi:hypothetical protein
MLPTVETVTVQEVPPPTGTAEVTVGAAPERLAVASEKLEVVTPDTASLNVTVKCSGPDRVGLGSARRMDTGVGWVLSTV